MRSEGLRQLREKMKATGARQVDVARATGRTEPTVYGWLLGRSTPDTPSVVALWRAYGIPPEAWTQKAERRAS